MKKRYRYTIRFTLEDTVEVLANDEEEALEIAEEANPDALTFEVDGYVENKPEFDE